MNINGWGGRKFLATIGCGAVTSFLQYMGKLDAAGSTYSLVVLGTVGVFIAGNVTQKVKAPRASAD